MIGKVIGKVILRYLPDFYLSISSFLRSILCVNEIYFLQQTESWVSDKTASYCMTCKTCKAKMVTCWVDIKLRPEPASSVFPSFLGCHGNVYLLVCHVPFPAKGAVRILHRARNHMTDQQIYFSGWTRFVHTCLGLICENWIIVVILFHFALLPEVQNS